MWAPRRACVTAWACASTPATAAKRVLFAGPLRAGCSELRVEHSCAAAAGAAAATTVVITVPVNEANAARRGQPGLWPYAEEIRDAALRWLVLHKPSVLENDVEHALRTELNGTAYVLRGTRPTFLR